MVSIVVAVYNSEKYLNECVDSLLNQTYQDIELICVNDGSKDKSLEILKEYETRDSRVKVFSKQNEGKGAASARNMGLDHATGEYVFILDSDDFFEPDLVEVCVNKSESEDADVIIYGADMFNNETKRIERSYAALKITEAPDSPSFSYKDVPEKIFQIGELVAWNKMFRRELIEKDHMRFDPIPISDDQYVPVIGMVEAKKIAVINRPLLHYRFNTGSSQVDNQHKHPEAAYMANYTIVNKLRELGVYEEVKRSYVNMSMRLMREYFDHMRSYETIEFLYNKYKTELFEFIGAENLPDDYFYDDRLGEWYRMIRDKSLEEILFSVSRGFGDKNTTGILRFQVPYDSFPKGGKAVIVGKGLVGRYWYAQLLLSNYCDVVAWVDKEEDIPDGLVYDKAVTTIM